MLKLPKLIRIVRELMRDPKNPGKRLESLHGIGKMLVPGYRFCWPDADWIHNAEFNRFLTQFSEIDGYNTHRRWALAQLMRLIHNVPGDTAECGVYRAAGSHTILLGNVHSQFSRHHHIFDSFQGISKPGGKDGDYWTESDLTSSLDIAESALQEFSNKSFYPGWIPERFSEVADCRFALIHVDVDLYQPTLDSIRFFYDRMNVGGIFICDDYGLAVCPGATQACDEFLLDKPEKMLAMPDGAGFFIKGCPTSNEFYKSTISSDEDPVANQPNHG